MAVAAGCLDVAVNWFDIAGICHTGETGGCISTVNSADINVALGRPASQSSSWYGSTAGTCSADRAVDGNDNTDILGRSCAGTKDSPGGPNWWRIDLGQRMHIKRVVVTNRGDQPTCGKHHNTSNCSGVNQNFDLSRQISGKFRFFQPIS